LEQKGDKLYSAVPLPFLSRLFAEDANAQTIAQGTLEKVWHQVVSAVSPVHGTASQTGTITTAVKSKPLAKAAAKVAGLSAKTKAVLAGATAVAVIAGVTVPLMNANRSQTPADTAAVSAVQTTGQQESASAETPVSASESAQDVLSADYYVPDTSKTYVYDNGYSYQWIELDQDWYGEAPYQDGVSTWGTYGDQIKDGSVYWTHYSPGGAPIEVYEGECIELAPVGVGESWESNWKAHTRNGDESYGYMKKTFTGWETLEVMGQTMTAAHLHVVENGSYMDEEFNLEYDQWLVKGLGVVKATGGHAWEFEKGNRTLTAVQ